MIRESTCTGPVLWAGPLLHAVYVASCHVSCSRTLTPPCASSRHSRPRWALPPSSAFRLPASVNTRHSPSQIIPTAAARACASNVRLIAESLNSRNEHVHDASTRIGYPSVVCVGSRLAGVGCYSAVRSHPTIARRRVRKARIWGTCPLRGTLARTEICPAGGRADLTSRVRSTGPQDLTAQHRLHHGLSGSNGSVPAATSSPSEIPSPSESLSRGSVPAATSQKAW